MKKINHILIVEDEVFIAMAMKAELQSAGIRICEFVSTGEKALEYVAENNPEVVLMDIHLAGELNGIETAEIMRRTDNRKLIFISGYEDSSIMQRIAPLKPLAFLEKPVYTDDLLKLLAQSVD